MKTMMKHLIVPVLAAVLTAGVANAAMWQWSKVAANNATADPSINYSEGMSPSSVNDSARAAMARTAEWRDDISGSLNTAGTSTAYTLTTNEGIASVPTNGQMLAFTPHATNGAASTLRVDGGTIYALQTAPGTAVASGVLIAGTPYTVKFNSSAAAWILRSYYGDPFNVPIGAILDFVGSSIPSSNYAWVNGQCISRTTYATLFGMIGTFYGVCDGSTTFGLPDLQARYTVGADPMPPGGGPVTGRITAAGGNWDPSGGSTGGAQNRTISTAQMPSHTHTGTTASNGAHAHTGTTDSDGAHTHSITDVQHNHPAAAGSFLEIVGGGTLTAPGAGATATIAANTANAFSGITGTNSGGAHTHTFTTGSAGAHTHTFTSDATGGGATLPTLGPSMALPKIIRIF